MFYRLFIAASLIILSYCLGALTGYAVGYNDSYAEKVVAYRLSKHGR